MFPPATLELSLLGTFAIRCAGRDVHVPSRKGCAVLGYLAATGPDACARETLLGLLWSGAEEDKARASLRQVLHELQRVLPLAGYPGLSADRLTLRLAPQSIATDVGAVLQLAREGRAHPRLLDAHLLLEDLLRDFDGLDPAFDDWLIGRRSSLRERLVADLSAGLCGLPAGPGRLELAHAILGLDPTHEEAARSAMRAHARDSDVAGALRIYRRLWETLESAFGAEPTRQTQELVAAIKLGRFIGAECG